MITFSVIVPTFNRPTFLKTCLSELYIAVGKLAGIQVEVIVTDDSDDYNSIKNLTNDFPEVIFLQGPRRGPAANRNNGAKTAIGKWLLFLDDDILPSNNLLIAYSESIKHNPSIAAYEGAILPDNWNLLKKDMAECPVNTNGGCFWSANVCIKKELFLKIDGFDEQYTIAAQEDQDIFQRIKSHTQVPFLKNAIVIHPVRIIKMGDKIRSLHLGISNWFKYSRKHDSISNSIFKGFSSQFNSFFHNIQQLKFKSAFCNFYVILIFLPTIFINIYAERQS